MAADNGRAIPGSGTLVRAGTKRRRSVQCARNLDRKYIRHCLGEGPGVVRLEDAAHPVFANSAVGDRDWPRRVAIDLRDRFGERHVVEHERPGMSASAAGMLLRWISYQVQEHEEKRDAKSMADE